MKKTLQRELKTADNGAAEVITNHTNHVNNVSIVKPSANPDTEVNHLYMKNVIMKFLTSREYEVVSVFSFLFSFTANKAPCTGSKTERMTRASIL